MRRSTRVALFIGLFVLGVGANCFASSPNGDPMQLSLGNVKSAENFLAEVGYDSAMGLVWGGEIATGSRLALGFETSPSVGWFSGTVSYYTRPNMLGYFGSIKIGRIRSGSGLVGVAAGYSVSESYDMRIRFGFNVNGGSAVKAVYAIKKGPGLGFGVRFQWFY